MYLRIVSFLGLAALAGAGWAAPGDTTGAPDPEQDRTSSAVGAQDTQVQEPMIPPPDRSSTAAGQQEQVQLVATDELIGRDVLTREGERVGTLEYITLDLDQGNVSHLVLNPSGNDFEGRSSTPEGSATGPGTTSPTLPSDTHTATSEPGTSAAPSPSSETTRQAGTSASGQQADELLVIPWSIVDIDEGNAITITATRQHIASAPRLNREELQRLAEPATAAYVLDYWAPASEMAALEGRDQRGESQAETPSRSAESPETQNETWQQQGREMRDPMRSKEQDRRLDQTRSDDPAARTETFGPEVTAPTTDRDLDPASAGQLSDTAEQTEQPSGWAEETVGQTPTRQMQDTTTPGETADSAREDGQMVLVGQQVVTAITPPMFQLSEDLQGAAVTDRSGEELGQIRRIMIDAETGNAAFAVLDGTRHGRAAVPLQSLEWTAQGSTMLSADPSALQSDEAMIEQPSQVDRNQLAQLYERFDVEPYWQQSSRSSRAGTLPTP